MVLPVQAQAQCFLQTADRSVYNHHKIPLLLYD